MNDPVFKAPACVHLSLIYRNVSTDRQFVSRLRKVWYGMVQVRFFSLILMRNSYAFICALARSWMLLLVLLLDPVFVVIVAWKREKLLVKPPENEK